MTEEVNQQVQQRREKLTNLRSKGVAFPNDFRREHLACHLHEKYDQLDKSTLEEEAIKVVVAGRMMTRRIMGKASFATIQDMSGQIQIYLSRDSLPEGVYQDFKTWDLGDIVGVEGVLMKTKTGELSIFANRIRLLTKALRPLPDKFHGLTDQEQRFRQRYLDLIANPEVKKVFMMRSKIVSAVRDFMERHEFVEVETPMMHAQPGGAAAKPFVTHHNALGMEMFMRVAPELYLKRLVVGGFEKVFEVNRNFRNEGVSTKHNPEFTMLEFYWAYADYNDLMDFTEAMLRFIAETVLDGLQFEYQTHQIDLSKPIARLTLTESIVKQCPAIDLDQLQDFDSAKALCQQHNIKLESHWGLGRLQMELFEALVEDHLIQPVFITEMPAEVSPLARKNDKNPLITDRFELFVAGRELANGFSELNDPEDQAERFKAQLEAKQAGDDEAMSYDEDYIMALEHGLPPTAGEGIGIDRLVMLFTNCHSIRDVILFPLLRSK